MKTLILSFETETGAAEGPLANLYGHVIELDIHSTASNLGGLTAEAQQLLDSFEPYILTDSFRTRVERLKAIINELDSFVSLLED